jgi:hypothetical protein
MDSGNKGVGGEVDGFGVPCPHIPTPAAKESPTTNKRKGAGLSPYGELVGMGVVVVDKAF